MSQQNKYGLYQYVRFGPKVGTIRSFEWDYKEEKFLYCVMSGGATFWKYENELSYYIPGK